MRLASLFALLSLVTQTSCVLVGGYSSEGGWHIWPWSLVISAVVIGLFLLLRRRR